MMTDHDTSSVDPDVEFDQEAAAGLSDEGYREADEDAAAQNAEFDPEAAAGLSDDEYTASAG